MDKKTPIKSDPLKVVKTETQRVKTLEIQNLQYKTVKGELEYQKGVKTEIRGEQIQMSVTRMGETKPYLTFVLDDPRATITFIHIDPPQLIE